MARDLWAYDPNTNLALATAALFSISTIIHLVVVIKRKTWFYTAFVIGGFMMTMGYVLRYLSAKSPDSVMLFAQQSLFIILPPSLYAATMYMIFGRMVLFVNNPRASLIRPQWVTKIFVTGDLLSFFMQGGGGGIMAGGGENAVLGQKIIMVGLAFQLLFFGFFLIMAITFRKRMLAALPGTVPNPSGKYSWHALLMLLLLGAGLIIARCIFRLFEFGLGQKNVLTEKEVWVYLGDTLLMFLVQILFHFSHAGNVFVKDTSQDILMEGQKGHGRSESYKRLTTNR
ncbi:RTA1 like protein-domain-containing protein [Amylocarpus encephaloides]|uniref:RTA1 like protein-domain-containing protein n=1 Tax=Amylocarpus encephaloides TaxID=45428 RepID=A0A9P7YEW7_9HELO|nr:RTA1 like protein-domain-containing protein [Amylocarpus encephaloides]